ncbi:MAG: hypothetical protein U0929_15130 [Planctomycetaceae bacterium]
MPAVPPFERQSGQSCIMSVDLNALRYLTPYAESFWKWEDGGEAVVFRGGGTLAFRPQLLEALKPFASRPLPPLELVLLVLAACRETWPDERRSLLLDSSSGAPSTGAVLREWWKTTFEALDRVHGLPAQMRTNPRAVATILEIVLERVGPTEDVTTSVMSVLSQPRWLNIWSLPDPPGIPFGVRARGYTSLSQGLVKLTTEEVLTRTTTGLNQLPVLDRLAGQLQQLVEDKKVTEKRTVQQLIEELRNEDEFFGLMQVVRKLSAVLTIPRSLSTPDELPQGGVSDISNRGSFHQLLLSELANDDDTLTTRVALNEALYLRRETPPSQPVHERVLLIDTGIRMWGLPRLCATAVGVCLATQVGEGLAAHVFRAARSSVTPVDFSTRAGLVEHLSVLECHAHPGHVLQSWKSEYERSLRSGHRPTSRGSGAVAEAVDRILITGEDVLEDSEFRQQLNANAAIPVLVVTVNRAGRVRLIRVSAIGDHVLKELWIDIDELTSAKKAPEKSLIDTSQDSRLPAIFRMKELPLRLPYPLHDTNSLACLSGESWDSASLLQVTRDGRLLVWDQPNRGGRQLSDKMPVGQLRWSGKVLDEWTLTLVFSQQGGRVDLVHLAIESSGVSASRAVTVNLETPEDGAPHIYAVEAAGSVLLLIQKKSVIAVNPETGECLSTVSLPSRMKWVHGRCFSDVTRVALAGFSDGRVCFDRLFTSDNTNNAVSQCLGIVGAADDPIAVLSTGEVMNVLTRERRRIADYTDFTKSVISSVSPDGQRFVVSKQTATANKPSHYQIDLRKPGTTVLSHPVPPLWMSPSVAYRAERTVIKHVLWLGYGRNLAVMTKSGHRLMIDLPTSRNAEMTLKSTADDYLNSQPFAEIPSPRGARYTLKQVVWSDGSRAILDSRGMLHLQSSDQSIPEMTLVLSEKSISGWCSTGEVWGSDYFINEHAAGVRKTTPHEITPILQKFLARLM